MRMALRAAIVLGVLAVGAGSARSVEHLWRAAAVDAPAERTVAPIKVTWVGGSEISLLDVSLIEAVRDRLGEFDGRAVSIEAITQIAPMPSDIEAAVQVATAAGSDAIIVSANIAWLTWERPYCDAANFAGPVERYVCVLSPISPEVTERRSTALHSMLTTLADTIPAYLYLAPHSTTALDDPRIADLIERREAEFATLIPASETLDADPEILTRGRDGFDQPVAFFDMVHPTREGAQRLADLFAPRFAAFLGRHIP